jgi:hypothetical protein
VEYTKWLLRTHEKSKYMHEPIKRFEAQVQISIPQWEDSRNMFERMRVTCIADILTRHIILNTGKLQINLNGYHQLILCLALSRSEDVHIAYNVFSH